MTPRRTGRVLLSLTATAVALSISSTASAAPSDVTELTFEVIGASGGGLNLAVAPAGGVLVPVDADGAEIVLPGALVLDNRGGGPRNWSASITTTGFATSFDVSYKVVALSAPDTGSSLNRMPDWSAVSSPGEAVAAVGISRPSVEITWSPRLHLVGPRNAFGSIATGGHQSRGALVTSVM